MRVVTCVVVAWTVEPLYRTASVRRVRPDGTARADRPIRALETPVGVATARSCSVTHVGPDPPSGDWVAAKGGPVTPRVYQRSDSCVPSVCARGRA
jgi:hypothetical protein